LVLLTIGKEIERKAHEGEDISSVENVHLGEEYDGQKLLPQTLSGVLWRHYLHPEDKSLAPDGQPCGPYTKGLLLRRPIRAMIPFIEETPQQAQSLFRIVTNLPRAAELR
jgi:hypothetical protein